MKKVIISILVVVLSIFALQAGTSFAAENYITKYEGYVYQIKSGTYDGEMVVCIEVTGGGHVGSVLASYNNALPNLYASKRKALPSRAIQYFFRTGKQESHFICGGNQRWMIIHSTGISNTVPPSNSGYVQNPTLAVEYTWAPGAALEAPIP
jgi:hypothetical protein